MSTPPSRARLLHRTRAAASLIALGLAALPLAGWSHAVEVAVDGQVLTTRTYATTVGAVLDQLEVPLGPADEVTPSHDASLEGVETIDVDRAITVDVVVDGATLRRVTAPVGSVAGVMTAAGLDGREHGATTTPGWTAPVADGDTITLHLPRAVNLTVDGVNREVRTLATTVGAMLADAGVELGPDDTVDWELDAPLLPASNVTVGRVTFDRTVEEVTLEHGRVERRTDELLDGVTEVETEGADCLRRDTYRIERVDGDEVDRELVTSEVVRESVDEVVLIGTGTPPPPPPPPPPPAPAPATTAAPRTSSGGGDGVWDRLARCESGGNWAARGMYHGGLQFHPDTWRANKPSGAPTYAYEASRAQQIAAGERVLRTQGWAAWPHCSSVLGLR